MALYSLFFLKKDLSLIKYLPTVLSILRDYHKEKIRFDDIIDTFGHIFEDYCVNCKLDFDEVAKEFWDKNEKRIKPFYKEIQKEMFIKQIELANKYDTLVFLNPAPAKKLPKEILKSAGIAINEFL